MEINFDNIVVYILYFGLPALSVIWFIVSLILYLTAPKKSKKRDDMKVVTVISGILAFMLVGAFVMLMVAALIAMKNG